MCDCCFLPKVNFGWITQTHKVDSKLLTHIWMSSLWFVCVDACVYTHACACLIVMCSNPRWRSEHHSPCLQGHHPGSPSPRHCPSHHHPLWPLQPPSDWLRPGCLLTCPVQANCVTHNARQCWHNHTMANSTANVVSTPQNICLLKLTDEKKCLNATVLCVPCLLCNAFVNYAKNIKHQ